MTFKQHYIKTSFFNWQTPVNPNVVKRCIHSLSLILLIIETDFNTPYNIEDNYNIMIADFYIHIHIHTLKISLLNATIGLVMNKVIASWF